MEVSIKFKVGGSFKPGLDKIKIGKYMLIPLPSRINNNFEGEMLLKFEDEWAEGQLSSDPKGEGDAFLAWLSLILKQKIMFDSWRLNKINLKGDFSRSEVIKFSRELDFQDNLEELFTKTISLNEKDRVKFIRACECYQQALLVSDAYPEIALFLLVIPIECLATKDIDFYTYVIKKLGKNGEIILTKKEIQEFNQEFGVKNSFIKFVLSYYHKWKEDCSEEDFKKILSSYYLVRSMFTHGGTDSKKIIYFPAQFFEGKVDFKIKGKKTNIWFKGVNYLSNVVRETLLNYLSNNK